MSKGKKKSVKARKVKAPVEPRWEGAFKKITKFCTIAVVVLLFLLTIFAGLDQELKCYIIDINVKASKTADSIIEDTHNYGGSLLVGVEHIEISAPKGTGNYLALFEDKEVWVVSEMTTWESLKIVAFFTILDVITYAIVIILVKNYMSSPKYKVRICFLVGYEILFLLFSWIVHSYSWTVLFNNMWLSPAQTVLRLVFMSVAVWMFNKDKSIPRLNRKRR